MPLRTTPLDHAKAQATRALSTAIERECGAAPERCPHSVFSDPLISSTLDGYRVARSGGHTNLAAYAATNPPELLFRAVMTYDRAVDRALAARRKREDAARTARAASSKAQSQFRRR